MSDKMKNPQGMIRGSKTVLPSEPSRNDKRYGIYTGFIVDSSDLRRMGRLRIWIPELGADKTDKNNHVIASYCTPFAGSTNKDRLGNSVKTQTDTQTSYGFWMVPPDEGTQVLVSFINGDSSRAVWLGCLFDEQMNHSIPGHAVSKNYQTDEMVPSVEYNKLDRNYDISRKNVKRPWNKYVTEGLGNQGLLFDNVRGVSDSSARREDTSQVFGISTPGPELASSPGSRAGGHQFVMDDRVGSEYIRFRTRSGAQIKIDETNGIIYIINRDGTGWIEMDHLGNIDIFGAGSLSFRAKKDVNIRADGNLNLEAGKKINIKSTEDATIEAKNLYLTATEEIKGTATGNVSLKSSASLCLDASGLIGLKTGALRLNAGAATSTSIITLAGVPAPTVSANSPIPTNIKTDVGASFPGKTQASGNNPSVYKNRQTSSLNTIVARLPTFEPCPEHTIKTGEIDRFNIAPKKMGD